MFRLALVALPFAVALACDLNPQPEVPGGTAASGGVAGVGAGGKGGYAATGGLTGGGGGAEAGSGPCGAGCASGDLCNAGACVPDLCASNSCDADQACKPNAAFTASNCVGSCATVSCPKGQSCVDGACQATGCADDCAAGEVCLPTEAGFACTPNPCDADAAAPCGLTETCEPASASCIPDPCNGVKCPANQQCSDGQCYWEPDATPNSDAAAD